MPPAPTISPRGALARLLKGNQRFVEGRSDHPATGMPRERAAAARTDEHLPVAAVLACADARLPVYRIFDQGIGDLFVVRVAGNVCGPKMTGSLEFGVTLLGAPLLLVLGHTDCGAVKAAIEHTDLPGNIGAVLDLVAPAVRQAEEERPGKSPSVNRVVALNAFHSIERLLTHSELIADLVREDRLLVVAAVYDIQTGAVELLGEHPDQRRLLGSD
ncbi:MAG: carbonic anhydrase [Planctomycetota bacterium]